MEDIAKSMRETLDVNEALQKKGIEAAAIGGAAAGDLDKLVGSVDRVLRLQREKKLDTQAQYSAARAAVVERHRAAIERIRHAAEDELQSLDQAHQKRIAALDATIDRLQVLRGM